MKLICILVSLAIMSRAECIPIAHGKIVARDLAGAVPGFSSLDPETVIGFAPAPGVQRVLSSREVLMIARRQGLETEGTMPSVCVERAVQPISRDEINAALVKLLVADARLEIFGFSNQGVPPGRLEFAIAGLNKPPADKPEAPVIWRGRLVYDDDRSMAVWAKVSITVQRSAVVAAERIQAGTTIRPEQLKVNQTVQFPFAIPPLDLISQVAGRVARQNIPAGQRIAPASLAEPTEVLQGERVRVRVVDGLAVLSLEAIAQSAGSRGDAIQVLNPATGKSFRGVVEDKGKVMVRPSEGVE